jgi:thymidine phosphorylase
VVIGIDAEAVGWAAVALGAGRATKEDAIDPAVGFELLKKVNDPVERGEPIVRIHHRAGRGLDEAGKRVGRAYRFGDMNDTMPAVRPLVLEVLR